MKRVSIIGMGLSPDDLTAKHCHIIRQADILVGGRRHLACFENLPAKKIPITKDLKAVLTYIQAHLDTHRIVVLASGDPLFFGVGSLIVKAVGKDRVRVLPNISAVAGAFARFKEAWGQAGIVSLHGRDHRQKLLAAISTHPHVAVFTDPQKNPAWICRFLISQGVDAFQMGVFEQLGTPEEKVGWYELHEAAALTFADPNLAILTRKSEFTPCDGALHLGMEEDDFAHEQSLITKTEVRAVTLAKLKLMPHHTLWDLGAGSGSVAVEAAVLVRYGRIVAVEQNPARIAQIEANAKRFGLTSLTVVQAVLPAGLDALPAPDRVFIGGGGRKLGEIIRVSAQRMSPGTLMVVNTVLTANLETALKTMDESGFETAAIQIQVNRSKAMPFSRRFVASDPVWIVTGTKKDN
jgi:precorrin-6Y C5,15-methyltransferase (decarboxylating)